MNHDIDIKKLRINCFRQSKVKISQKTGETEHFILECDKL